jgi:hypothetical protein
MRSHRIVTSSCVDVLGVKWVGSVKQSSKTIARLTELDFSTILDVFALNTASLGGFARHVRQVGVVRGKQRSDNKNNDIASS